jgi:hypothetical protein
VRPPQLAAASASASPCVKRKRPQREGGKAGAVPDQSAPRRRAHPTIPRILRRQLFQSKVRADKSAAMKDYQASIEKLRRDAAEAALIRDLATDKAKREMFDMLAVHLSGLADQVEKAMIESKPGE